jgi:hypothetical protein
MPTVARLQMHNNFSTYTVGVGCHVPRNNIRRAVERLRIPINNLKPRNNITAMRKANRLCYIPIPHREKLQALVLDHFIAIGRFNCHPNHHARGHLCLQRLVRILT